MVKLAHFIPVIPFAAFWLIIIFGRSLGRASAYLSVAASSISTILAFCVFQGLLAGGGSYTLATWLSINGQPVTIGVIIDSLTVMMLLVVTVVGTLIQIYSIGYMQGDVRYPRFFAYLSLFMACMLALVMADNLLLLYIFWEGVGLCSCLLVAFWHERPAAAAAGIKAFITTRVGDTGLLIGILILIAAGHSLQFSALGNLPGPEGWVAVAALLIFLGAVGKSAQFPLHVWLPDAMEGPTAVSALIHAATMVAAGVYLVARSYVLFLDHPLALQTVAIVGAISAVMAASIACTANDIKRILAYSTISQLGLMMLGLGVGGYGAGTFHLMTHAFFKALLFLGAGSVIHAVHTQDIREMGGLLGKMKITGATFIIGALALAGIMPFAGFWSKDEIFLAIWQAGNPWLFGAAALTSFFTAFYMARLIFLAFFGKYSPKIKVHESPRVMTGPLMVLAAFSVGLGFLGSPMCHGAFQHFIEGGAVTVHMSAKMIIFSTALSLSGIALAYLTAVRQVSMVPLFLRPVWAGLVKLVANKYYCDEIYEVIVIAPFRKICGGSAKFDFFGIDALVNAVAHGAHAWARVTRRFQTGLIENYLLVQVGGIVVILGIILGEDMSHILSLLVFLPLAGAAVIGIVPADRTRFIRLIAIVFNAAVFILAVFLCLYFDRGIAGYQFLENASWIPQVGIRYMLGVDGISLAMVFLTALLGLVACLASRGIRERVKEYYIVYLVLMTGMMGTFLALDLVMFYIFWETVLIPMFFLIGIWGGPRREYAAWKFFFYTLAGSIVMLLGILALYFFVTPHTFNMIDLAHSASLLSATLQGTLFVAFFIAFAIKIPVFPFHTWLPDAHVEAPTPVSVLLAGVLLKMGAYGLFRICVPFFPQGLLAFAYPLALLGVINLIYGACVAFAQTDFKKMIAYSSVSHMGFVLLGVAAMNETGFNGGLLEMFNHGTITGAMFLLVGVVYDRAHTRELSAFGGLSSTMPRYAFYLAFMALASLGLPGLSGFVGEFLSLAGVFAVFPKLAVVGAIGLIALVALFLMIIKKVLWGKPREGVHWPDMSMREMLPVLPLVAITLVVGFYPEIVLQYQQQALAMLVKLL